MLRFVIILIMFAKFFVYRARERRKSFAKQNQFVPRFPKTPDPLVRTANLEQRRVCDCEMNDRRRLGTSLMMIAIGFHLANLTFGVIEYE